MFGNEPGQGSMIDENTWQSNSVDEPWLPFPRQRYYSFDLRALGGRIPHLPLPYVSPSPTPAKDGMDFVVGSGNLAKLLHVGPNRIDVLNDTCSDFYLRLIVEAQPFPPAAPADGGADDAPDDAPDAAEPTDDGGDGGDDADPTP